MNPMRRVLLQLLPLAIPGAMIGCASGRRQLTELGALPTNKARVRWDRSLDDAGVGFLPSVVDARVWACDQDGRIVAVQADTGKVEKSFDVDRPLVAGVAASDSIIVVIDAEGTMRAFDPQGKSLWHEPLTAEPVSVPTLSRGLLLVRLSNGTVVAHDAQTGKRRWLHTHTDAALILRQSSQIVVDSVNAYVGLSNGQLVALSLATGATAWETRVSVPRGANEIERITDVVGAPVVDGATICAAAYQGRLACVNANNGALIWSEDIRAASGIAINSARAITGVDIDGRVTAWSSRREQRWQQDALRGRRPAAPAFIGDAVWLGDGGGFAHALDPVDGRLLGRVKLDSSAIVAAPVPLFTADAVFALFQTSAGTLAAVGLE